MKREGFTLIELLVVIAVIALMIAILLPSLRMSRLQTEAVLCKSNINQLLLSMTMYEYDYETFPQAFDDTLLEQAPWNPPPGGYPGDLQYDRTGWWWFHYIVDYLGKNSDKDSVICCPSKEINDIRLKDNVLCGNYGVNLSICKSSSGRKSQAEFIGTPLSRSNILHPSRTLLIIDSGYSMISWWHVTDVPPIPLGNSIEDAAYVPGLNINKEKTLWPGLEWDAIKGRHSNKTVNVGFADGHVERTEADDLFVEKTETGYDNRHPLWRPIKNNND